MQHGLARRRLVRTSALLEDFDDAPVVVVEHQDALVHDSAAVAVETHARGKVISDDFMAALRS
jgi:hypothetical protein